MRWLLPLLLLLLPAAPAQAEITGPPGVLEWAGRMAVPRPATAHIAIEPCPMFADLSDGCALADGRVYLKPVPGYTERDMRLTLYHELGHLYAERLTRRDWRTFRRIARDPRFPRAEEDTAEQFADAYANCAIDALPGSWRFVDGYGYQPSRRDHRRVCAMIRARA